MYTGHVKYPLLLSYFIETCIFHDRFSKKILKYQISWKPIHREPSCSTWKSRYDRIVAFRNFAKSDYIKYE
jgi:hypothetical protein